jgi:cysteine desulfurase / selenocysteine lyase
VNFPTEELRTDFPILAVKSESGVPIVYLDNAATSQKPRVVIDAIRTYYEATNANVHRGMHTLAEKATAEFEAARETIARFIGAPASRNIIFTRGTTESINLVAHAWGRKFLQAGDEIILSLMEHHSNIVPWQLLAQATGATLKYIPMHDDGTLDLDAYREFLKGPVKLVSVTHVSNALGTVNPIAEMITLAHDAGARILIDSAQGVPHMPVDVQALDADFLAFSAHKMCGPTGFGVLYGKEELLESMDPFLGGGEMINKVDLISSTWAELPYKFEAGTPNICGAIVTATAIDYLERIGLEAIHQYVNHLTAYATDALSQVEGLTIHGHPPERGGAVPFNMNGLHPHDISQIINEEGIAIRAGHVCCQPLMARLGKPAIARASFYFYNTVEEIDRLVASLATVKKIFRI